MFDARRRRERDVVMPAGSRPGGDGGAEPAQAGGTGEARQAHERNATSRRTRAAAPHRRQMSAAPSRGGGSGGNPASRGARARVSDAGAAPRPGRRLFAAEFPVFARPRARRRPFPCPISCSELFSEEIPARTAAQGGRRPAPARHRRARRARLPLRGRQGLPRPAPPRAPRRGPARQGAGRARGAQGARGWARRRRRWRGFLKSAGLASIDEATIESDPEEGRFLRRQDRAPRAADARGAGRDPARRDPPLPLAEVDALGRGLGPAWFADLGSGRCARSCAPSGPRPRRRRWCASPWAGSTAGTRPSAIASTRQAPSACAGSTTGRRSSGPPGSRWTPTSART